MKRSARPQVLVICILLVIAGSAGTGYAQSNTWSNGASIPTPRYGTAFGVIKGKVYVVAGSTEGYDLVNNNEIYNPTKNKWTTGAPIPTVRWFPASAVVANILYVIGGSQNGTFLNVVEAYDPVTNAWSTKAPLPTAAKSMYAVSYNGIIYVVGGCCDASNNRLATVFAYNPAKDSWMERRSLHVGKSNPALGVLGTTMGTTIIAAGGYLTDGEVTTDDEIYSPYWNAWKTIAPIPTARTAGCFGVISGSFYVASGGTHDYIDPVDVLEVYSAKLKTWMTGLAPIPQAVVAPASAVVNKKLYCIGGVHGVGGVPYPNVQISQP